MAKVGDDSYPAVQVLIQHLALKVPERAEFRQKASGAIITMLLGLPHGFFTKTVYWFFRLAHTDKSAHRQFAIEVIGRLLAENEREKPAQGADHDYGQGQDKQVAKPKDYNELFASHQFLFGVIFSKCKDNSALVRAKALNTLADVTAKADENPVIADVINSLFDSQIVENATQTVDFLDLLGSIEDKLDDNLNINPLPKSQDFIEFLRRRALDDSVFVRKHALAVLENILRYYSHQEDQVLAPQALDLVSILSEHCRDPSVMVRKQIVVSLTEILKAFPDNLLVINKWVEGVFPLILDVEQKAAEKVLECIWEVSIANIVSYDQATALKHFLPWKILNATEKLKMTSHLSRACSQWAKDGLLKAGLFKNIKSHIDTENSNSAWLLLALITGHIPLQDPQYVMEYFNNSIHTPEGVGLYTLLQVLRVLLASVSKLKQEQRKSLQKDLITLVTRFSVPPELISTAIDIATIVSWLESGGDKSECPTPRKPGSEVSGESTNSGTQ